MQNSLDGYGRHENTPHTRDVYAASIARKIAGVSGEQAAKAREAMAIQRRRMLRPRIYPEGGRQG